MNRVTIADLADLSEVEFDRRLKAERDALAAKYDHRPNLYNSLAEQDRIARATEEARRTERAMFWRATVEVSVMVLVAVFCGYLIAVQL